MSEGCRLLGDQALHEPEPFHSPCSQRVLPFPHLQRSVIRSTDRVPLGSWDRGVAKTQRDLH
jgi:hypothetical protein